MLSTEPTSTQPDKLYLLRRGDDPWRVVDKDEWVWGEREAGFYNTMGRPTEPGTGGFQGKSIHGAIAYPRYFNESGYDYDPELGAAIAAALAE